MSRSRSGTQEVNCVVALSTSLYPALLHRKAAASAGSGFSGSGAALDQASGQSREACVPGVVLEVRELWRPALLHARGGDNELDRASSASRAANTIPLQNSATLSGSVATRALDDNPQLYAFVRVKDADHRLSGWFPLQQVYVKADIATAAAFGDSAAAPLGGAADATCVQASDKAPATAAARGLSEEWTPLSRVLRRPWLSAVYDEVTPGMARTQRARRQLDYLEERLLRDCRTPTTVRYFVYLNTYVFSPWYYAPFGLLNCEYDPTLPSGQSEGGRASSARGHVSADSATSTAATASLAPQPYIRDAFLCPFSLRIFSTYAQLHYETRTCRAGRLRPPGDEIYRDDERGLSLFRINGSQHVTYCRHLFLIGKSFLENKLAGHDVHSYYFYVVCLHHRYFPQYVSDKTAMYFAGFFTWEKQVSDYNLACIATLPCFGRRAAPRRAAAAASGAASSSSTSQLPADTVAHRAGVAAAAAVSGHARSASASLPSSSPSPAPEPPQVLRNIGQFMIAVSYELAYRRKQIGTPEKPLSDLGAAAYQHYWRRALVRWMKTTLRDMRHAAAHDVDSGGSVAAEGTNNSNSNNKSSAVLEKQHDGALSMESEAVNVVAVMAAEGTRGARAAAPEAGKRKRSRAGASTTPDPDPTAVDAVDSVKEGNQNTGGAHLDDDGVDDGNSGDHGSDGRDVQPGCAAPPVPPTTFSSRTTVREIAAAVRLEEADVLKTLLGLGVLHRSSEDRSLQLLLPQRYVDWLYDEVLRWESSLDHAVFQPALLRSRGRVK